jgi:thiol-disulfide isomerase/thioredoxin
VNPIAYWTFEDTFDYIAKYEVAHHPLHAKGYPSIGDAKDTIPIPEDGSTKFANYKFEGDKTAWLDYASERKGRFVGLVNKDGSTKTECGIHVEGAEKTFDRDLWDADSKVVTLDQDGAIALKSASDTSVMVVYAPWCQFCQAMEDEYEKLAASLGAKGITVSKYRGDEDRDFVTAEFDVKSFPTINAFKAGKMVKYDSEVRDVDALTAFVESM